MITASTHGAPNWVDLSSPDIEGSVRFYGSLFGWDIEKSSTPMGDYFIGTIGGNHVAGMMAMDPDHAEMPPMWTTFFNVDEIDKIVAKIESAGGSVLQEPFEIPGARVAVVTDSVGAMFALIDGPPLEGTWLSQKGGSVCWVETMNRDLAGAEAFYADVFAWKAESELGEDMAYTTFMLEETPIAGMMMMPEDISPEVPAHWGVYFSVDDCMEAQKKTLELGGSVIRTATETEMGYFAVLIDPQGAVFQVMDFAD